ncbi:MAG TPA: LemA family protein [Candidatus Pacearchaeota archaeon]|nr:LemA family protein [Candidatus Parcubacteria bacterium]HNZ83896.1 LemA family protein [Candidatus Pacearchaeota archaeon]HPM08392.1 LemA family protein [Candidatus Pacearchaeota archaeon]
MSFLLILGILVLAIALFIIANYNDLIKLKIRAQEAWSDIDIQLKRRYDLIPNLVETVKGYAAHEQQTLEKVIQARNAAMSAQGIPEKAKAENDLAQSLKSIFALSENYPDLKAAANFKQLQDELVDTENKIQASRRFYNANVRDLNIKIDVFPANIIASMFNFSKMSLFEIQNQTERENISVKF